MRNTSILTTFLLLLIFFTNTGCNKFIDLYPKTEIDETLVFSDDQTATSAVIGLYAQFMSNMSLLNGYLSRFLSLYVDELDKNSFNTLDNQFLQNDLKPDNEIITECWHWGFNYIYHANAILEGLEKSENISVATRQQLEGETKFIRALIYFYLVNLYGDLPLVISTSSKETANLPRSSESSILQQIIKDLLEAKQQLTKSNPEINPINPGPIRATQYAAATLLARAYLYNNQLQDAISVSTFVIESKHFTLEQNLENTFLVNSREAILSLYPTTVMYNAAEGRIFGINPATGKASYLLSECLVSSFKSNDQRLLKWSKNFNTTSGVKKIPFKYREYGTNDPEEVVKIKEQTIVLRLPELYLIRAEAFAALGEKKKAIDDINEIRKRAQIGELPTPSSLTTAQLNSTIETEYQHEYFTEMGMRWLNLRRWKSTNPASPDNFRIDDILSKTKPGSWEFYKRYWPIPKDELMKSSALSQNPGYK